MSFRWNPPYYEEATLAFIRPVLDNTCTNDPKYPSFKLGACQTLCNLELPLPKSLGVLHEYILSALTRRILLPVFRLYRFWSCFVMFCFLHFYKRHLFCPCIYGAYEVAYRGALDDSFEWSNLNVYRRLLTRPSFFCRCRRLWNIVDSSAFLMHYEQKTKVNIKHLA